MASNYTQPVNIGNPVEHTIEGRTPANIASINRNGIEMRSHEIKIHSFAEFAVIIRDLVGGKMSKIETMPAVEDDPQRRKPDIARAKKYLNWEPRIPLKIGLERTIEYFRKELDRSNHSNRNVFLPKSQRRSKPKSTSAKVMKDAAAEAAAADDVAVAVAVADDGDTNAIVADDANLSK